MRRGVAMLLAVLLILSGCAVREGFSPTPPSPPPTQSGEQSGELTVSADWSKLEDGDKPPPSVGSRWYDDYTGQLILRDDYGKLIPYAGLRLMDDWPATTGCLYGLMTTDGVVVTDAVYSAVRSPCYYMGEKQGSHPLLALYMMTQPDETYEYGRSLWAIAASDGSWCTEFCYLGMRACEDSLLLFEDDRITYMSPTGEIMSIWTMAGLGLSQKEIDEIHSGLMWGEGYFGQWFGDYFCLGFTDDTNKEISMIHLPTGQKETMTQDAVWEILTQEPDGNEPGTEDWKANLPPGDYYEFTYLWDIFSDDVAPALISVSQREEGGAHDLFFLRDGTPLPQFTRRSELWYYNVRPVGGLIEVLDLNTASYYDIKTMDCVFRTYLGYDAD